MKRIIVLFSLLSSFILAGCTGSQGPAGPTGGSGTPAANTFQATFQNGVYPDSSYSGEIDTWLDGGNASTSNNGNSYRRIKTGATYTNYGRLLVKFDISTIPVNVSVISAEVILQTQTTTSVSSTPVTVGVHDLASSLIPSCIWTLTATWNQYNGSNGWNACDSDATVGQQGMLNPTVLSSTTFTNAINGLSKPYRWTITPSVVSNWLAGKNNGLVLP